MDCVPALACTLWETGLMPRLLKLLSIVPTRFFRSRCDLLLENLALRQQLGVFKTEAAAASIC